MKITARILIPLILIAGFFMVITIALPGPVQTVSAQCSRPSSCQTCHETQAVMPMKTNGSWHSDHAIYDFCADCHGGGKLTADAVIAHKGTSSDLNAMQTACASCHDDNYAELLQGYATQIGTVIDPNYQTVVPASATDPLSSFLGSQPAQVTAGDTAEEQPVPAPRTSKQGNLILSGLIVLVGTGGGGYVYWNENRKKQRLPSSLEYLGGIERSSLETLLSQLSPDGRDALEILLDDPAQGEDLLIKLALLEPSRLKKLIDRAKIEGDLDQ